jgi:maleate cis-trans isomerase
MTVDNVLIKSIEQIVKNAASSIETDVEKMDKESKVQFYTTRLSFLNHETEVIEHRKKALQEEIEKETAEFKKKIIALSCDVASVEQLWMMLTKDTGVAELKLKELQDAETEMDAEKIG